MNSIALKLASRPKEFVTDQEWDDNTLEKVLLAQNWQQAMNAYSLSPPITKGDSAWMALQKAINFAKELSHHYEINLRLVPLLRSDSRIQELIDQNNQEWVKKARVEVFRSDKSPESLIAIGKLCSPYVRKFINFYVDMINASSKKWHLEQIVSWLTAEKDPDYKKRIKDLIDDRLGIASAPCRV